jgi:hypothetical protein
VLLNYPHIIAFLDWPKGDTGEHPREYISRFFESKGHGLVPEVVDKIAATHTVKPPFVDQEAKLRAQPAEVRLRLKTQERQLLENIGREWHIPPDEKLVKSTVEVLSGNYHGCPPGTVVVVRQTDRATVAYLLPRLQVDMETLAVRFEDTPVQPLAPPAPVSVGTVTHGKFAMAAATGEDVAGITLRTASTLAFALPEPWGIAASAGLSLIDMLLPGEKRENPFQEMTQALETFHKQDKLNEWVSGALSLTKWINEKFAQMKEVGDPTQSKITGELLPDLEKNLAPGGESLYDHLERITSEAYIKEKGAFDILLACVSSYLGGLRFKLLLEAKVANLHKDSEDETFHEWNKNWRFDYVGLKNSILGDKTAEGVRGWAPIVAAMIDAWIAERLGKVTPVKRMSRQEVVVFPEGGSGNVDDWGWGFYDEGNSQEYQYSHFYLDTKQKIDVCHEETIEHRDDATIEHNSYVFTLSTSLDETYKGEKKIVKAWVDSINQWNEHLPPNSPKSAPKIDSASWQGAAPSNSPWAQHTNVKYAIAFYNDRGPGPRSEWSAAAEIQGRAYPTIKEIPIDDLLMATGRRIYRKFDDENEKLIALIPDNKTTTYVDKKD